MSETWLGLGVIFVLCRVQTTVKDEGECKRARLAILYADNFCLACRTIPCVPWCFTKVILQTLSRKLGVFMETSALLFGVEDKFAYTPSLRSYFRVGHIACVWFWFGRLDTKVNYILIKSKVQFWSLTFAFFNRYHPQLQKLGFGLLRLSISNSFLPSV